MDPDENEVQRILDRLKALETAPKVNWNIGDRFKVIDGPFKGMIGRIEANEPDREILHTLVDLFGRQTPIQLHPMDIEKL
jgi:transcriptional antiterminator NusG